MKILQVFNRYLYKGGEEASVDRIYAMASEMFEVERCLFSSKDWKRDENKTEKPPNVLSQALRMIYNPEAITQLREHHYRFKPDLWLVHNVFPVGSAGVFREAQRLKVPIVYYCHNFRPFSVNGYCWAPGSETAQGKVAGNGLSLNFWQEIKTGAWQNSKLKTAWFAVVLLLVHRLGWFESVRAWIAISDFVRTKFIEGGLPEEKVITLKHSLDLEKQVSLNSFDEQEADVQNSNSRVFLFMGRLSEEKGIHVLLEAWRLFIQKAETPVCLQIAGEGPLKELVEKAASIAQDKIVFLGHVDGEQKHKILSNCSAMVVPSVWWEALGMVVHEAYLYSKPVLASRSGGLVETVHHGQTGLLHPPGDVQALARHFGELTALNTDELDEMGLRGRYWLNKEANPEIWKEKFQNILKSVL